MIRGIVQGVGFRPYVFALANRLSLGGSVRNRSDGVLIEIEGPAGTLASFLDELPRECPPVARIDTIAVHREDPRGERQFSIEASDLGVGREDRFFPPDVGTCQACIDELFDPSGRRYRYPFISCAFCGPRFTIICDAPYDRERTTMAPFEMCSACRAEYDDPTDRHFHAQPIACPACGPRLLAWDARGREADGDPLEFGIGLLRSGGILAVKGLGGYHLACDAGDEALVQRLRERKHREQKPFAVLIADLDEARRLCHVSGAEADLLQSQRRPVVLLRRRDEGQVAPGVAPGNPLLGLMLPYTPLHHLLIREARAPLVLTSGNRSDEPIACDDRDAQHRLAEIADGFLGNDRAIRVRCDDSVVRALRKKSVVVRRSRGYTPEPMSLPFRCPRPVLALGGHLKNTFAAGRGRRAFLSHHVGDLDEWSAYRSYGDSIEHFEKLLAFEPEVIAYDLHPDYATTEYARERVARSSSSLKALAVQHHHAHMASCMAENGLSGPAIGVTFDGLGYGTDGTLWGGEFLVGDYRSVRRAAHLRAVPLPGGDAAVREPWRMAASYLLDAGLDPESWMRAIPVTSVRLVRRMVETRLNSPLTSSAGRLFDAVAALVEPPRRVAFEAQAAMELEWMAERCETGSLFPYDVAADRSGGLVVDTRPLVTAIAESVRNAGQIATVARMFHNTVVDMISRVTTCLHETTGIGDVVLSGGVFQNVLVLEGATRALATKGLRVHSHAEVPTNDGGLSLGQLVVAAANTEGGA